MLTHIKGIVAKAQRGSYAVPAFNTANLETTLALINAAVNLRAAIIIQISQTTADYAGLKTMSALIREAVLEHGAKASIALHLDHGKEYQVVANALRHGFGSVHMDGSDQPLTENIKLTRKAVASAKRYGAWVQGELNALPGKEGLTSIKTEQDMEQYLTDPEEAAQFVAKTGINTLAVSVGTWHGVFAGKETIHLDRLAAIHKRQPNMPLVLHGASGIEGDLIKQAVKRGVRIINIDTNLRQAFINSLDQEMKKPRESYNVRTIMAPAMASVQAAAEDYIKILGAKGRA